MRKKKSRSLFCQVDHLELRQLLSTVFVSSAATGTNDGSSWTNAYTDLQTALGAATSGTTIEVGQGTYKPTTGTDRTATFQLVDGVTLQGGYAGTGQSNPDARDTTLYPTILSGEIGASGGSDNSYHVVYAHNVDNTASLDGFTITAGNANGSGNDFEGGGIFTLLSSSAINNCTISGNSGIVGAGVANVGTVVAPATLTNCTITGNTAGSRGGGVYNYDSSPSLANCTISGNMAHNGGGVSDKNSASPALTDCIISGNTASTGGGIGNYTASSPTLTDCIIAGNAATENGGGIWNNGSSPALINCVISGNTAPSGNGGGMYSSFNSYPALTNCTLSGNSAKYGGAMYNIVTSSATLTNSILWDDTATVTGDEIVNSADGTNTVNATFSDIDQSGFAGSNNNIDSDPKFLRAVEADGPSDFGNLRLQSNSPAMSVGNASASGLSGITTDLDGLSRTVSSQVDMGAYEAHYAFQSTVFVDASASGANTGSSWTNAYPNLAAALDYAVSGETIDVAGGTYYAAADGSRFETFQLVNGVSVLGGFAGQADPTAPRNVSAYPTILSGDIGTPGATGDNTYNVVTGSGTNNTAVLDGFTITAGYASNYHPTGGGIVDSSGSPTITDCIISGNTSTSDGAGMFNYDSSPILNDCTFSGNTGRNGGGIVNEQYSSPVLTDCTISGNTANQGGGGIYNSYSSPALVNCIIRGNNAGTSGGGIGDDDSSPTLINCTLSGNSAVQSGGAFFNMYAASSPTLTNCTISGNNGGASGGALYNSFSATATLTNCILWDDTATTGNEVDNVALGSATISDSDVDQSGFAGSNGNIDADPMFVRNVGTNGATDFGDLNLKIGSPAIDVGSNPAISGTTTDLNGNPRIINGTVDMGAYESRPIIFVDASATGTDDGTTWTNAYTTLTAALASATAGSGQSIDVAQGTYKPTTGTDRTATFQLIDGVSIEGGFAGQANPNAAQNASTFPTILSGDIDGADSSDNSYHVVTGSGTDSTAVLDGFTVTAGNADGTNHGQYVGGGILVYSGDPEINDCIITGNSAVAGGGIYENIDVGATLTGCVITGNTAADNGGGLYIFNTTVTLINTVIADNSAKRGGGLWNDDSVVTLTNCTISGNTASTSNGGGLYGAFGAEYLSNCILWGDTAQTTGNEIQSGTSNTLTVSNSDIDQTGFAGSNNNIDADPKFVRAVGTNGASDFGDLHLTGTSPAINAGSNAAISGTTTDLDGNARIVEGTVDMGAYEAFPTHLAIITQPGVTDTAGSNLPIVIDVEDQYGDIFAADSSSIAISFANNPTGATLGGTSTATAQNGVATFNAFSLTKAGSYTLSFSNGSLPVATSNTFAITPTAPASLTITQQPTNTTAGQTISTVVVQVKDQFGNLAAGTNVSVALGTAPSGATLTGTTPTISGAVDTFSNLSLTQAGSYTLTFTDASLPAVTSSSFTINPAAASMLVFTSQPQDTLAGQTLSTFNIAVEDQFGNVVTSDSSSVTLTSTPAGASATVAASSGIASFTNLSITAGGTYTLAASDGSLTSATSNSFAITASGPHLAFAMQPISAIAGAKFSPIVIDTDDVSGNIVTGGTSTITLTLSSGAKIYGSTKAKVNKKTGEATFKNISIRAAGTYTLTATDTSDSDFTAVQSTPFTISAAAAKKLIFNSQPANVTMSTPFNVSVELVDKYGNAVNDGSTVDLVLGSHPKTAAALSLTSTVSDGLADFDGITLDVAGPYTLKASDGKAKATSKKFVVEFDV